MSWLYVLGHIASMVLSAYIITEFYMIFAKKMLIPKWIYCCIMILFIVLGVIINLYLHIKPVAICLLFLIYSLPSLAFCLTMSKRALLCIIIYVLLSVFEIFTTLILSLIIGKSPEQALSNASVFFVSAVLSKVMMIIVVKILSIKFGKNTNNVDKASIIVCIVLSIITFVIMAFISLQLEKTNDEGVIIFGLITVMMLVVSDILILYLFNRMTQIKEQEHISLMEKAELENEREYYSSLYAKQSIADKTLHDLKHKAFALEEMMDNNIVEAKNLIHSITETLNINNVTNFTNSISIDSLLNKKMQECKTKDINFNIQSYISTFTGYDAVDICIILGNLLDNAIEGCVKLEENRHIEVMLKQDETGLIIKVSNSYDTNCDFTLKTSKKDIVHHGYGITNVKAVVEKYNGYYDVSTDDNVYVVTIYLDSSFND